MIQEENRNTRLDGSDLTLGLCALLQFGHLLSLYRGCSNFLTQNDISDLANGQRGNVDAVAFAEILISCKIRMTP